MPEILKYVLCLIAAYLVGSIPMAYLVVKWRYRVDLRNYGSGVVGAGNVFRSFSRILAVPVFAYDVGKGALVVWIAHLLGFNLNMEVLSGIAVVAGHNWPVFLRFNAGRGLATTIGVEGYLFPLGIVIFVGGAVFTLILGSSPLPTLVGIGAVPLASWIMGKPLALTLGTLALFLILLFRRLSVPLTAQSRTVSKKELYLTRLLFDRDIRDSKPWLEIKPFSLQKLFKKSEKNPK
jgi:acyl phosphate:glycerol-3-phosphate acyltransferase